MDPYTDNPRSPATPSPSNPNPSGATVLERKPGWLEDLAREFIRNRRAEQGGPENADLASQSENMATVEPHTAVFKPEADLSTTGLPKWADPESQESPPSQPAGNSMTPATEESDKPALLHNYEVIGIYLGSKPEYKKTFRYDDRKKGWFEWYDNTWVNLDERIPFELLHFVQHRQPQIDQELETLSSTTTKHTAAGPTETRDFLFDKKTWDHFPKAIIRGLTRSLTHNFPDYEIDSNAKELRRRYLAVPSGVVDLKTGEMTPHNPLIHDTQAITTGDYRPRDADYLSKRVCEKGLNLHEFLLGSGSAILLLWGYEQKTLSQRFDRRPVGGISSLTAAKQTQGASSDRGLARSSKWRSVCAARRHTLAHGAP